MYVKCSGNISRFFGVCFVIRCSCDVRYERYSQNKGWKFEVLSIAESDLRGYKVCIFFDRLVYEVILLDPSVRPSLLWCGGCKI